MSFEYDPPTGLLDTSVYPDVPASPTAARQQFMDLFYQARDQIGNLSKYVSSYGADKTGVTPSSTAINNAISSANAGDVIRFSKGTYLIDAPILWNKKVSLIADGIVTLRATVAMDSIIKATGFTAYTDVHLDGFYLDGNNLANHCIKIDGSSLYAVKTVVENCECRNALLDGIIIIPPAWDIAIKNTLSNSNGRDGIRAIMSTSPGTNQINNVLIDGCVVNDNTGSGINMLGIINSIVNCDIENNNIGIKLDASAVTSDAFFINIVDNYIEGNNTNQIYVNSPTGDGMFVNVAKNYLNPAGKTGTVILCAGIAESITLNYDNNKFDPASTNVLIDGGNTLGSKSFITSGVYLHETKFINLGFARIVQDMFGTIMLPASSSTAPSTSPHVTGDLTLLTPKKVEYPVQIDLQFKLLKLLQAKIVTNATSYNLTATVNVIDLLGTVVKTVSYTITGVANQTWAVFITNDWGFYRIPKENFITVSFLVNSITASSYITINNVCLSCI